MVVIWWKWLKGLGEIVIYFFIFLSGLVFVIGPHIEDEWNGLIINYLKKKNLYNIDGGQCPILRHLLNYFPILRQRK